MLRSISPIGPYGIDKTNRNGQLFLSFLVDNKLCSALTWSKGDFSTWRHPRYGEHHLDHLCVPRKMLNRVTKQGRYAYTETDHLGVTMDFRNEKKLLPKNLLEIQWEREEKKKEAEDRPPEADFRGIYSDPVLKARMITELEAIHTATV